MPKSAIAAAVPTVYVVQHPKPRPDGWVPDLQPANKFGKLVFVFDAGERAFTDPTAARDKALEKLKNFDFEQDYLLWANFGDPCCLWLVILMLGKIMPEKASLKFLYWSRGRQDGRMSNDNGYYFPVELRP